MWFLLACHSPLPAAGPNVLLITVDTLRADHLGAYGHPQPTSPAIDALAAGGTTFDRALSPRGATWPALTTLHTSWPPVRHGVRTNGAAATTDATTLAEALGARYRRAAVLTNTRGATWEGLEEQQYFDVTEPRDPDAVAAASRWLAAAPAPFFLWVHLMSPHDPYVRHPGGYDPVDPAYVGPISDAQEPMIRGMFGLPPFSEADLAAIRARYDGEVAAADRGVAAVLAALDRAGHTRDTLVVLTADHGEELAEHPPYLFHFSSPYDGVLHVPLVVSQPGVVPAGRRVGQTVGLVDVAPTILDLLQLPAPAGWLGRSMVPSIRGETQAERPHYAEIDRSVLITYDGPHVHVDNRTGYRPPLAPPFQAQQAGIPEARVRESFTLPTEGLWDLREDPSQQHNLAGTPSPELERLRARSATYRAEMGWPGAEGAAVHGVPGLTREALEAMGYLAP